MVAAGSRCQAFLRLDTSLAGAANATRRLTEASGVVHDVPLHGFVIGGYTRDGDQNREVGANPTRSSPL